MVNESRTNDVEDLRRLMVMEYETLRKSIDKFDELRYRVKTLTVTVNGALVAVSVDSGVPAIAAIGLGAALLFAFVDLQYTLLQQLVIDASEDLEVRLDDLRRNVRSEALHSYRFGVGKVFYSSFPIAIIGRALRGNPHFAIFHVSVLVAIVAITIILA